MVCRNGNRFNEVIPYISDATGNMAACFHNSDSRAGSPDAAGPAGACPVHPCLRKIIPVSDGLWNNGTGPHHRAAPNLRVRMITYGEQQGVFSRDPGIVFRNTHVKKFFRRMVDRAMNGAGSTSPLLRWAGSTGDRALKVSAAGYPSPARRIPGDTTGTAITSRLSVSTIKTGDEAGCTSSLIQGDVL